MLRYLISTQLRKNPFLKTSALVADNISTVISIAAVHPIDVVHSLMQSDSIKYPSIPSTAASLLKSDGISGLYRGLVPTVLGYIPYRAVQYVSVPFFESLSDKYDFMSGVVLTTAIATTAQVVTYPFEVLRKRMMTDPVLRGRSFTSVVVETYQQRGIAGFYDSLGIAMVRVFPIIWMQQVATREFRKLVARFNYAVSQHKL
jgi:solute carrier family 25 phosphate transporter 23/24/25/41